MKRKDQFGGPVLKSQSDIMNEMIMMALGKGIFLRNGFVGASSPASEGSVADYVVFTTAENEFVTKLQQDRSIIREANFLNMLRHRDELPRNFSRHFPRVYHIKDDRPPYGYTMERFRMHSLAEHIFSKELDESSILYVIEAIFKILLPAYIRTKDTRTRPSTRVVYLERITERIKEARLINPAFKKLSSGRIRINGTLYEPPEHYLELINNNFRDFLVPFTTFIHGDCHPENILVDLYEPTKPLIRLIDPRGQYNGDYMFDIGKIVHYLSATGPAQRGTILPTPEISLSAMSLNYKLDLDRYHIPTVMSAIDKRIAQFAHKIKDKTWKLRYQLSLASNLLGVPTARLRSGEPTKVNAAFMIYGEGLIELAKCCM